MLRRVAVCTATRSHRIFIARVTEPPPVQGCCRRRLARADFSQPARLAAAALAGSFTRALRALGARLARSPDIAAAAGSVPRPRSPPVTSPAGPRRRRRRAAPRGTRRGDSARRSPFRYRWSVQGSRSGVGVDADIAVAFRVKDRQLIEFTGVRVATKPSMPPAWGNRRCRRRTSTLS